MSQRTHFVCVLASQKFEKDEINFNTSEVDLKTHI